MLLLKPKEDRQIVSLGNSPIKCVCGRLASLSALTVRVVVLEYSHCYMKRLVVCE